MTWVITPCLISDFADRPAIFAVVIPGATGFEDRVCWQGIDDNLCDFAVVAHDVLRVRVRDPPCRSLPGSSPAVSDMAKARGKPGGLPAN